MTESAPVILVHGGPGAPGSLAPLRRALESTFRVSEPYQRHSDAEPRDSSETRGYAPLTVARHIADLGEIVESFGPRPALVGHSWGAMLALAYAAVYPDTLSRIALVGCGTFDMVAREAYFCAVAERNDRSTHDYDPVEPAAEHVWYDKRGHDEAWQDMLRLQREGVYPWRERHAAARFSTY